MGYLTVERFINNMNDVCQFSRGHVVKREIFAPRAMVDQARECLYYQRKT